MVPNSMLTSPPQDRRTLAALAAVLPPAASIKPVCRNGESLVVEVAGQRLSLLWLGRVAAKDVRRVSDSKQPPDVIVGTEISGAAQMAATQVGIGWVAESGAAEILTNGIIVSRQAAVSRRREPAIRWTPSVLSVAEAILSGIVPTVSATADATGHAPSATAHALNVLEEMGLLAADAQRGRDSGRRVHDADRFLDEYAIAAARAKSIEGVCCGVQWRDPLRTVGDLGRRWTDAGRAWAVTGVLGAAAVAPYLSDVTTGEVYVDANGLPELLELSRIAGIEPIDGGRLTLRPFPTAASRRLAIESDGLCVVPWPRLYADVRKVGVRGEEAAEHLKEIVSGR